MTNPHTKPQILVDEHTPITLTAEQFEAKRPHAVHRFELPDGPDAPLQIEVRIRTRGVTGVPGKACAVFFNVEYATGPVFWDTFCFPDTGSTSWRWFSSEVMARGPVRCVEMHVCLQGKGTIEVDHVRVQVIEPPVDDADLHIAILGDSTDMTCNLPHDLRLSRRFELLLRDRFSDHRIDVHNFAEGGDYLKRVLDTGRLERELSALSRCDIVMIRYGLNDAPQKIEPAAFEEQLETAIQKIGQLFPTATVVLSTTIPPLGDPYAQPTITIAKKHQLPLIRIDEMIRTRSVTGDYDWHNGPTSMIGRRRDEPNQEDPTGLKGDLHPNAYGSQMIAECYFQHLEPIVAGLLEGK